MAKVYFALVPSGGGFGAMDKIDGNILDDQDMCYVLDHVGERFYPYTLDAILGGTASPPDTVEPISNAGTKRWVLVNSQAAQWDGIKNLLAAANTGAAMTALGLDYDRPWFGANSMDADDTNSPISGEITYATNGIKKAYWSFPKASETYLHFDVVMPPAWDRATVKFKAHWTGATGCSVSDTCEWQLQAVSSGDGEALDQAFTDTGEVISDAISAADGANLQITGASPAITINGTPGAEDLIHFKLSRNISGTDNMAEDAWLFGILMELKYSNSVTAW